MTDSLMPTAALGHRLQVAGRILAVLIFAIVNCGSWAILAAQPPLPTTEEFHAALAACALGLDVRISADILGSVSSIYSGQRSSGAASFKTETRFLELFPEGDRAKVYELYQKCIEKLISSSTNSNKSSEADTAQRIAIGDWVVGNWMSSEFDTHANILARIASVNTFSLFRNAARFDIRTEVNGKALYENDLRISNVFDDMQYLRVGLNSYAANMAAVNVRRGSQWTVAINGKPWNTWFQEMYEYAVLSNGSAAIGVRTDNGWTIAVDGIPWRQRFDRIVGYNIFPNRSVVAEVISGGRDIVVKDGVEDDRLPNPRFVRINEKGKTAWYNQGAERATVTVGYNVVWKSSFPRIVGLVVARETGRVAALALLNGNTTAVVDDIPWAHWYQSDAGGFGICNSSVYLRVRDNNLWTLVVNDSRWTNWFDEFGPMGCEESGAVSAAVRKGEKWAVARNGRVITDWVVGLRGWAINPEGNMIAASVAERKTDGALNWQVIVSPISK